MADEATQPKPKSTWKVVLGLLIVLALLACAVLYYGGYLGGGDDDVPPALDLTGQTEQGMLVLKDGYVEYTKDDTVSCKGTMKEIAVKSVSDKKVAAVFAYPLKDLSFEDIRDSIKAKDSKARVLLAYWNERGNGEYEKAYTKSAEKNKNWYVYPGWSSMSMISAADLDDYKISAYQGFYIVVWDAPIKVCKDDIGFWDTAIAVDKDGSAGFYKDYVKGKVPEKGWVLMAANDGDVLKTILEKSTAADSTYTVGSVWAQKASNNVTTTDFQKVDLLKFYNGQEALPAGFGMLWLKIVEHDAGVSFETDSLEVVSAFASVEKPKEVIVTFDEEVKTIKGDGKDFGLVITPTPAVDTPPAAVTKAAFAKDDKGADDQKKVVLTLDEDLTALKAGEKYKVTAVGLVSKDDGAALSSAKNSAEFTLTDYLNLVGDPVVVATATEKTVTLTFDQELTDVSKDKVNFVFKKVVKEAGKDDKLEALDALTVTDTKFQVSGLTSNKKVVVLTTSIPFVVPAGDTIRLIMTGLATAGGDTFEIGKNYHDFVGEAAPVVVDYLELKTAVPGADGLGITLTFDEAVKAEGVKKESFAVALVSTVAGTLVPATTPKYAVVTAEVDATDAKKVNLTLDKALATNVEGTKYELIAKDLKSTVTDEGLEGGQAKVQFDYVAPVVDSLEVMSAAHVSGVRVDLVFDEAVDGTTGLNKANYTVVVVDSNGADVAGAVVYVVTSAQFPEGDKAKVRLNLDKDPVYLEGGDLYKVTVNNVKSAEGDALSATNNFATFNVAAPVAVKLDVKEAQPVGFSLLVNTMALDVKFLGINASATGGNVVLSGVTLELAKGEVADLSSIRLSVVGGDVLVQADSFAADKLLVLPFATWITVGAGTSVDLLVQANLAGAAADDKLEINLKDVTISDEGVTKTIGMDIPLIVTVQ